MQLTGKLKQQDALIGTVRSEIQDQLDTLHFAGRLWQLFRAIINGALLEMQSTLGKAVNDVMEKIDQRINEFFVRSLQLDVFTMRLESAEC